MNMEAQISQMRQQILDLQDELHTQTVQADFWKRRANELEQSLNASTAQSTRWRELARETVEKLWDLGQEVRNEEFAATSAPDSPVKAEPRKTA